ncbi:putative beta-glucosidase H [Mariannaea sp. PMI_226]|nr:putative beta-glucosidase H [Mariannaea sp. PMI_226]
MAFDPKEILLKLSTSEKISLLTGLDFWHTVPIPEHDIPKIRLSDGSSGIRGTRWFEGVRGAAIPCGTALAATWDRELLRQAGRLLGKECQAKGVHCWLGPTVNIQRGPLGGRGYESYSEDPHLTGILASEIIRGCEETGVISTIKHFVCNDQEHDKCSLNALVTERALREIYLRPFQIAARDANPRALMTSYNKVNGEHVSESKRLITDVVRGEWGWDPLVMSDWFGTYSIAPALNAGLDLEMPGKTEVRGKLAELAVATRLVSRSILDERAYRVLQFIHQATLTPVSTKEQERDMPEDRKLNRALAQSSVVLLKNDHSILPIPKTLKRIALIGSHMKDAAVHSTGATALEPYYTVHPFDAINEKLPADVHISYEIGAYTHKLLPILDNKLAGNIQLRLYNDPHSVVDRKVIDCIPMRKAFFQLLDYVNSGLNQQIFYGQLLADLRPNTAGLWQFGLAVHGTAKLFLDDELVIDNATAQTPGTTFFNKGTVEETGARQLEAGKTYQVRVEFGSASTSFMVAKEDSSVAFNGGGLRLGTIQSIAPEDAIERAVKAANQADYAVICTGLNGEWESEGFDRDNMDLPDNVNRLIAKVARVCPNTVVVNRTGMPVTMPWASDVPAIMQAWYGGNESGSAIADVLFGDFNPCGKLPVSWPHKLQDNPAYLNFGSTKGRVLFGEDIFVGYRWYDKLKRQPLWSFGHGLSYSTFSFSASSVSLGKAAESEKPSVVASLKVKNTGVLAGAEVLKLYVSAPDSITNRPLKELHGFHKVFLEPGEDLEVSIKVDQYAMAFWDESENQWCVEKGNYQLLIEGSSNEQTKAPQVDVTGCGSYYLEEVRFYWLGMQ